MTEIEKKALALVNEVSDGFHDVTSIYDIHTAKTLRSALCRAIEQHEAFRQEVSDAVVAFRNEWVQATPSRQWFQAKFGSFIIKPVDPLVEALKQLGMSYVDADDFRVALAARGLEIREKRND